MSDEQEPTVHSDEDTLNEQCEVHEHLIPPEEIRRYSPGRDPDSEMDIANYVEGQARDENVMHVEMIKTEIVMGERYDIFDVITDKNRWWVITNFTNLYSQKHFPSLDYTISFHIGLIMRMKSRPDEEDRSDYPMLDEVFRRQEQIRERHYSAIESEEFQAVGMQLRECMLSFISVIKKIVEVDPDLEKPKEADFIAWSDMILNRVCGGSSKK